MKYFYVSIPKTGSTSIQKTLDYPVKMFGKNCKHKPLSFYKEGAGRKYDKYFKFSTVRNPWDRVLSEYFWFTNTRYKWPRPCVKKVYKGKDFPEFLNIFLGPLKGDWLVSDWRRIRNGIKKSAEGDCRHRLPQIYFLNPVADLDFICRFENLQHDFNIVCREIGSSPRKLLRHNKTRHRRCGKPYWEYYDDETRDIVAEIYAEDIEAFGYEFGK